MTSRRDQKRVLIYSHDSFGLGHLRRCRAIAHSMVEADPALSILILSGSPIIGSFDFRSRVDFVRVPGVIKLRNGEYVSLNLHIDIEETLAMRSSIIRHTADIFDPDMLIVDKEPLGLRGEVRDTLQLMQRRRTTVILGLRDVMDDPEALENEWERKHAVPALSEYYDELWVYGLPQICDPLAGLPVPASVRRRMIYTGYLRRTATDPVLTPDLQEIVEKPFLLVTPGGGGDGDALVDLVLAAYENDANIPLPALIVFGPFMAPEQRAGFSARAARLPERPCDHLQRPARSADRARRRRRCDGWLQHLLRNPVVRQAGADHATHSAPARAVHPRRPRRGTRPRRRCFPRSAAATRRRWRWRCAG